MKFDHCPNQACPNHSNPSRENWFYHHGEHPTQAFGTVLRYRCKYCGRTFSTQTFSINYFAKKVVSYQKIREGLNSGSGQRELGRQLGVNDSVIRNRIERMARWRGGPASEQTIAE